MKLLVLGASGFSNEVVDIAVALGHEIVGFVGRPGENGTHALTGRPIRDTHEGFEFDAFVTGIGATSIRKREYERLIEVAPFATLVHPSAIISPSATLGDGCLVAQNVVVNALARVGRHSILNVSCCVAHDCVVGDHVHVAPAVQMAGGSSVGSGTFCGTSTVILPLIAVGEWCVCGAGSVVNRAVPDGTTVVGVPAKAIGTTRS